MSFIGTQAPTKQRFTGASRGRNTIDRIVMHEPAVATLDGTIRTLQNKGLSVHYTIDRDGRILQHCPEERACAHAGIPGTATGHNSRSIGLEFINRYYGHRVDQTKNLSLYKGEYAPELISGVWVDRAFNATTKTFANPERLYIMPTHHQLEAGWVLVDDILNRHSGIKDAGWSGVTRSLLHGRVYNWQTVSGHDSPGVKAHAQWAHADGRVPDYYCLLRSLGYTATDAYHMTKAAASSMKRQTPVP
jgi:hypothetical protein